MQCRRFVRAQFTRSEYQLVYTALMLFTLSKHKHLTRSCGPQLACLRTSTPNKHVTLMLCINCWYMTFQVYMYQATCRMIADANPMKTQRLLQKSVMYHGCRHGDTLPGNIHHFAVMAVRMREWRPKGRDDRETPFPRHFHALFTSSLTSTSSC